MHENVRYEKSFLKEVVARIDFLVPVDGLEKALSPKLADAASKWFPIAEPSEQVMQEVQIEKSGVTEKRTPLKHWTFFGKDREKQLTFTARFMFVTLSRYSTYEAMRETWSAIVDAVVKAYPDAKAGRFGLRYINSIEIEGLAPTDWTDYIDENLLDTHGFLHQPGNLTRLLHLAEFKYGDIDLKFTFGMPNPDYPAVIKRPLFVLDLDGYVQTAHELGESLQFMDQAHEHIQDLFEKSIANKLRERMNVAPVPAI